MTARQLLQFSLYIFIFVIIVSPSLVITYYSYRQISHDLTTQLYAERQALARQSAHAVESRLDGMRDVGRTAARDIAELVEDGEWEEAVNEISYISAEFPFVDRIFLSDLEGHTTAYYPPSPENVNKDFSFRDWYKGVSKNWQPYASEVFKRAPHPQYNTVAMMAPINDENGKPLGAIGLAINLDSFYELSNNFAIDRGGFLYIVNQKGQIVAHPKYSSQGEIIDYSSILVVQKLLAGESGVGVNYNHIEQEERLAAYERIPSYGWGVIITDPIATAFADRDATLSDVRNLYIFIITLSVGLATVIVITLYRMAASKQALTLRNAQDEAILESIGEGLVATDKAGSVVMVNQAALKMWGLTSKEQLLEKNLTDVIHILDEEKAPLSLEKRPLIIGLQEGKKVEGTYLYQRADGSVFPATLTVTPILLEEKIIGSIEVFRDSTREKEIDRMKSEFISIASHQLKTPLTAMRWYSELLMGSFAGKLSKEQTEYATSIHTANLHMIELVNTLLNVSRIESGRMIVDPVETDLSALVTEVVESVQKVSQDKKQTLTVKIDQSLPKLKIDPKLMRQVYQNLLTNAIKYTPEKGTVTLTISQVEDHVQTSIADTGVGIPKADYGKVFQKFYRGENILKSGNEGTGLGLYLVKIILESSGCKIWFESEVNKGTTFHFTIPVAGIKPHKGEVELS